MKRTATVGLVQATTDRIAGRHGARVIGHAESRSESCAPGLAVAWGRRTGGRALRAGESLRTINLPSPAALNRCIASSRVIVHCHVRNRRHDLGNAHQNHRNSGSAQVGSSYMRSTTLPSASTS
jgi:hypothetical protein